MEWIAVLVMAVVTAVLCVLLKKQQPEQGVLLGLLSGTLLLAVLLPRLSPLLEMVTKLTQFSDDMWEYGALLVKGFGICILTQTAADTCRDAGEQGLAFKTELAGKTALLLLAVPLFERVISLATLLIGGQETG